MHIDDTAVLATLDDDRLSRGRTRRGEYVSRCPRIPCYRNKSPLAQEGVVLAVLIDLRLGHHSAINTSYTRR